MTQENHPVQIDDKQILRARARELARPQQISAPAGATLELVEFGLAQERYALETRWVREISAFRDLTPLPCCPSFVPGIVNVRGRIVPVFDIRKFFDLPEKGLTDLHRIILVGNNLAGNSDLELGLLADTIIGIRSVPLSLLQGSLPTLTGIRADYLKGVTAERLIVLDLARILADPRIIVHEEVDV
ncbi:MAG TPA: chemotaxis protein CheW [Bryobacteraceae bacterium]|jgi:purine-binding chemotaxis protein CheW